MTTFTGGRFDIIEGRLFFNKKEAIHTFNEVSKCNMRVTNGMAQITFDYTKSCEDSFALSFGENAKLAAKVYDFFKSYLAAERWERRRRWAYSISKEAAEFLLEGSNPSLFYPQFRLHKSKFRLTFTCNCGII